MNQSLTLYIILKFKLMHEVRLKKWHSPLKSAWASAIQPVLPGVLSLNKGTCVCVSVSELASNLLGFVRVSTAGVEMTVSDNRPVCAVS